MLDRLYTEEHRIFRDSFRKYALKEIAPNVDKWEEQGFVSKEAWKSVGAQGFLCPWLEEEYGGLGVDFLYSVIIMEELAKIGALGFVISLHSDIVVPYVHAYGNAEQKAKWLPGAITGDTLMAVAMTEPNAGSDLQGMKTKAVKDGDHWVINGSKTFISLGVNCDLAIVACITDPQASAVYKGISLIVVEDGTPGFVKGKKFDKMGLKMSDTSELFFEDCRVPLGNLLGQENMGFLYLMQKLQQERLVCSVMAQAAAETMLDIAVNYSKERKAFGRAIGSMQHNTFKIAEMATEVELGRAFLDALIEEHMAGKDIVKRVSMAKWWLSEMVNRVAYTSLQLHGGYGYMEEYPICRWYRDVRVLSIFAGTTEIMKQIIGKMMGF
jgi:acyl-CoA dehydrogenase